MPPWGFRLFVISSYLTMTNARSVGLVLTVLNHFHLFPSGPLAVSAEGPLTLWHRVNATGRFRPSGSWRGQRSGVGPRFRDAGPGSKAKTSARCGAFTRTGCPRPASDTGHCPYSLATHHSPLTTHHSPLTTRHLPSAIRDSEFGDPELGPFCMHDTLRNAKRWSARSRHTYFTTMSRNASATNP